MIDILVLHGSRWWDTVKLVTVFTPVWIAYDRSGLWSCPEKEVVTPVTSGAERSVPPAVADDSLEQALKYYEVKNAKREELVEEARADSGEIKFGVTTSLRQTWMAEQRLDPALSPMFAAKTLDQGYRKGPDGLLERHVKRPSPLGAIWVPIVPAGNATAVLTWKQWVFLQCHVGVLGAHRNAEKTLDLILRRAWWQDVEKDVSRWCQKCITCLRFRKVAEKAPSPEVKLITGECWEEVMIDLEGPWNPASKSGYQYTMTYICCLCHGVLLEHSTKCNAMEARRMFASCMFRSGTIPTLVRSDMGP